MNYVQTSQIPADIATHSTTPGELKTDEIWW